MPKIIFLTNGTQKVPEVELNVADDELSELTARSCLTTIHIYDSVEEDLHSD